MKHSKDYRVLVVATSKQTRGGITSVVYAHSLCSFWKKYHIKWIETHSDKNNWLKIGYAIKSFITFLFIAPSYDLIHIHLSEPPSLIRKIPFFLLSKLYKKKVIIHFHSFSPDTTINGKYKKLYYWIFRQANYVIVLSGLWKKWVKEYFNLEQNIITIYNPCLPISKELIEQTKDPTILYAGTICARKGYQDLIKAFAMIANKYPNWKICFAGNGEIESGKKLAMELDISSQIEFVGWISGTAKEKVFSKASIFCLPSYAEGFPVAILDACSYGIPFITTPVGGIPDIITNAINGLLFDAGDIQQLSQQLEKLISNTNLRQKLAEQSLFLAENTFNLKNIDKMITSLYELTFHKG